MEKPKAKDIHQSQLRQPKISFAKSAHLSTFIHTLAIKLGLTEGALPDNVAHQEMCQRFHEYAFNTHFTMDQTAQEIPIKEQRHTIKGLVGLMTKIGLYKDELMADVFQRTETYELRMTGGRYYKNRVWRNQKL